MYFRMTRLTKRHQVAEIVTAAARHGNNVMYLLNRSKPTLFQTLLAQRVSRNVPPAYLPPRSAVLLVAVGRADEFVIAAVHLLCVFIAVLPVTSVRAAQGRNTVAVVVWAWDSSPQIARFLSIILDNRAILSLLFHADTQRALRVL